MSVAVSGVTAGQAALMCPPSAARLQMRMTSVTVRPHQGEAEIYKLAMYLASRSNQGSATDVLTR